MARINITNTGEAAGAEVAQLVSCSIDLEAVMLIAWQYMSYPLSESDQPPRHLRGYAKPFLEPGQTRTVNFPLVSLSLTIKHHLRMRLSERRISRYGMWRDNSGGSHLGFSGSTSEAVRGGSRLRRPSTPRRDCECSKPCRTAQNGTERHTNSVACM